MSSWIQIHWLIDPNGSWRTFSATDAVLDENIIAQRHCQKSYNLVHHFSFLALFFPNSFSEIEGKWQVGIKNLIFTSLEIEIKKQNGHIQGSNSSQRPNWAKSQISNLQTIIPVKLRSLKSERTTHDVCNGLEDPIPQHANKGLNWEEGNHQGGNLKHETQSKLIQIIFNTDKDVRK